MSPQVRWKSWMRVFVKKKRMLPPARLPKAGEPLWGFLEEEVVMVVVWFPRTPVCICKRRSGASPGKGESQVCCLETVLPPPDCSPWFPVPRVVTSAPRSCGGGWLLWATTQAGSEAVPCLSPGTFLSRPPGHPHLQHAGDREICGPRP